MGKDHLVGQFTIGNGSTYRGVASDQDGWRVYGAIVGCTDKFYGICDSVLHTITEKWYRTRVLKYDTGPRTCRNA